MLINAYKVSIFQELIWRTVWLDFEKKDIYHLEQYNFSYLSFLVSQWKHWKDSVSKHFANGKILTYTYNHIL